MTTDVRMVLIGMDFLKEELSMLCALGWIVAGLLAIVIGGVALAVYLTPGRDPAGLRDLERQVFENVHDDMQRIVNRTDR